MSEYQDPFHEILDRMGEVRERKRRDYAGESPELWCANFVLQALIRGGTVEESFLALVGTKVPRLMTLRAKYAEGGDTENESFEDTLLDLANYVVLWQAFVEEWGVDAARKPLDYRGVFPYILAYLVGYPIPSLEELREWTKKDGESG